jgi:hypothetical protein
MALSLSNYPFAIPTEKNPQSLSLRVAGTKCCASGHTRTDMIKGTHAMKKNQQRLGNEAMHATRVTQSMRPRTVLWAGIAAGLAALAWLSAAKPAVKQTRRRADRGQERRNPLHFFLAGGYPRRRNIDRSGANPLFERRQSVYDSY